MLTLELLAFAMQQCKLPFHIQVASKGFMPLLVKLARVPDVAPDVSEIAASA